MLGTRAAAFSGKISNLRDSTLRIQSGTMPQPTCIDLANMLKYFCQVFHDFSDFKDIENIPLYASEKKDRPELFKTLPNFDYSGLYRALAQLVDILPLIPQPSNGYEQLCANLLLLFKCLVPFLDQANMETMPYLVSTLFISYPQPMHKMILDTLCFNLLPFTIDQQQRNTARMLRKAANRRAARPPPGKTKWSTADGGDGTRPFHCIVRIEDSSEYSTSAAAANDRELQKGARRKQSSGGGGGGGGEEDEDDQGIEMADCEQNGEWRDGAESTGSITPNSDESDEYAMLSVTSILMVAFHYIQEPMLHSQLLECLMKLKNNVFEDLLYVIAYGTTRARCPAVELLFRYWPDICPIIGDRKNNNQTNNKLKHIAWQAIKCQNKNCNSTATLVEDDEAVKMCLDFKLSIILSGTPPPMLVCLDCVDSIYKQQSSLLSPTEAPLPPNAPTNAPPTSCLPPSSHLDLSGATSRPILPPPPPPSSNQEACLPPSHVGHSHLQEHDCIRVQIDSDYSSKFLDLLLPMERVSKLCENKKCKSTQDRLAIGTCFDLECANYNAKKPIRYCKTCYVTIHEPCESNNYDMTLKDHIRHSSLSLNIMDNDENVNNFVEAIISLLKEAAPAEKPSKDSERHLRSLMGPMSQFSMDNKDMNTIATEEKQLISQYGIWLMTGLCKSVERLSDELLGRLLGMLFQWFHFTACLPDDQAGSALEKLKGECIKGWIMEVKTKRLDVFISCLLPHPIDCSKIGGHWEVWPDNAHQIKEGFKRLLCLVPYDIITDDVWDEIMPYWMECFRHEVPENELNELKILLSKVFDPELSPLGFETKQMYNFISSRFEDIANINQEQTLYWLQIITMLEIPIPINFLYQMLRTGVASLAQIRANELNKLKMVSRLRELDKRARQKHSSGNRKRQARTKSKKSTSGEQDEDQGSGSSDSETSAMSVTEDDVIMPNDQSQQASDLSKQQLAREQSRRERQAQARAAFSAKLFQQATMLDAQHGDSDGAKQLQGSQSVGMSPSATLTAGQLAGQSSNSAAQLTSKNLAPLASGESSPATSIASGGHCKPLKSTSSIKEGDAKTTKSSKPKLRLNVESVEEIENTNDYEEEEEEEEGELGYWQSKIDNNLVCYILMMDILLKQLDLQEISAHRGLDDKEAQQAIELLNSIISTPWLGKHTCCDSLPYTSSSSPTNLATAAAAAAATASTTSNSSGGPNTTSNNAFLTSVAQAQAQTLAQAQKVGCHPGDSTTGGGGDSASLRQDVFYSNIHSLSHCAQGFEHEDSYETCVFCEIISTFFQLSMALVEFFSPVIEVSICEVSQDAANGEFDGKPDYSRIGLDHLGPSPRELAPQDGAHQFDFDQQAALNLTRLQLQQEPASPYSPFSPSYAGPTLKQEVLLALPKELQLSYNLLVQFHQYQTPDIVSQLLQMIKLVSLHSQVLSRASKENPQFISWCQHNMLVNKLWSLCQLESSEIARTCVPLLLHCITLPWGVRLFRDLVERDFNSSNWLSRFRAVERVVTIAYFCEPSTIKNSTLLQSTMASAFCYVVRCLDDIEAIVAQRALVSLEMMKTSSLKLLLWCLEVQFDCITIDRSIILRSVFQLYNHLRDRRFLTWEFFLNRFDTIFLEAQIYLQQTGEIPSFTMQDLKNTNTKSEIYQKKIARAREALHETHHSRSLSSRFQESKFAHFAQSAGGAAEYKSSLKAQQQHHATTSLVTQPKDNDGAKTNSPIATTTTKKTVSNGAGLKKVAASPMRRVLQHGKSTSSRYQSIAFLTSQSLARRKNSKFMSNLAMQSVPPLMSLPDKLHQHLPNSFVDDGSKLNEIAQENHVFGVVHRICDEDRDTNHSLIFLLMQFFSKPDPSHPQSLKTLNRSHQIVLKHLNILMGYSVARKNFLISASNLRLLPVFNAFLTSLPKVLDFNYTLGGILLDTCLPVLIYCPAPDGLHFDTLRRPTYSLWLLNPLMRQNWLNSVLAFLYKYQFNQAHLRDQVNMLIWIIINTLESHLNKTLAVEVLAPAAQVQAPPAAVVAPPVQVQEHKVKGALSEHPTSETSTSATENKENLSESTSSMVVVRPSNSIETSSSIPGAPHSAGSSPQMLPAALKKRALGESIELHSVKEDQGNTLRLNDRTTTATTGSQLPPSSSSVSLKQQVGSSNELVASSRPAITKADTTDNLTVKGKFFQQLQQSQLPLGPACSSPEPIGAPQLALGATMEPYISGEERLLPIGPARAAAAKPYSANQERLLPIGYAPPITQVPTVLSKDTQTSPVSELGPLKSGLSEPQNSEPQFKAISKRAGSSDNFKSKEPATTTKAPPPPPLQGLRGPAAGMLLLQTTTTTTTPNQQEQISPNKGGKSKQSSKLAALGIEGPEVGMETAANQPPIIISSSSSSKAARLTGGRFGLASKQSSSDTRLFQMGQEQALDLSGGGAPATPSGRKNKLGGGGQSKGIAASAAAGREYRPQPLLGAGGLKQSFSTPSLLNEQLAQLNRHSYVQEFSDKDLSMCLVILETFIHHEPSMAAQMLPNILRLVARYSSANFESWQTGSSSAHMVGGSMFVARQFIRVALHDLMENNIFHQIFTSHFTNYDFYKSMSTALADFSDLNQLVPLSKLFEDLNKQKNLPPISSLMTILENVATYFECLTQDGPSGFSSGTWNQFIINWENFLRKLILALPRFSGNWTTDNTTTSATSGATSGKQVAQQQNNASQAGGGGESGAGSTSAPSGSTAAATAGAVGQDASGTSVTAPPATITATTAPTTSSTATPPSVAGAQTIAGDKSLGAPGGTSGSAPLDQQAGGSTGADSSSGAGSANASSAAASAAAAAAAPAGPNSTAAGGGAAQASGATPAAGGAAAASSGAAAAAAQAAATSGRRQNPSSCSMIMAPIMRIILATTKVPHLAACKTIVDPYSKILSYTVLNSQFKYEHLLEINHNCCRLYTREREKYLIQRSIAYELVQVLKFRFLILEENLLLLLLFVLQDVGGTLQTKLLSESLKLERATLNQAEAYVTNVSECLRQHMGDLLEFVTDVHAISRINDNLIGPRPSSINRDSFGGHVKAAISQYLALEISLSHSGDQRTIARYLPWLYNSPSLQQGPREFIDCVSHIRQLSWLILGSLQHSALIRDQAASSPDGAAGHQASMQTNTSNSAQCQPIPIDKNNNIAEHVQVVLAGFAEQSKESVLHMSSLYNAFLLCQLWTMYCENICSQHATNSEQFQYCQSTLDDFWAKITPGVLRLVGHSRMMSDMVSSHFLQLIESLIESESSILIRYLPMWNSVFYSYRRRNKSSIQVAIRLQKCFEWQPPDLSAPDLEPHNRRRLINWLEKIQYKMSHIEIQSSQATPYYLS